MSTDQNEPEDVLEDTAAEETVPEDTVPEDDAVIGRAFRQSMLALIGFAAVAGIAYLLLAGKDEEAPTTGIESSAPETVDHELTAPSVRFTNVTAESGVAFEHTNGAIGDKLLPESMGGGVAFFDLEADGDQDLLFVNSTGWPHDPAVSPSPTMAFYRNDGVGRFSEATVAVGLDVSFYGMGVAAADYDADGDIDLFLTAVGENHLYRNDEGVFRDVTRQAGVAGLATEWSTSTGFFDFDNDGDLDLFVGNYVRWSKEIDFEQDFRLTGVGRAYGPPQNYEGTFPYLYRNDGDGSFTDVSAEAGIQIANPATGRPMAKTLGLALIDVDKDGWTDVLTANDTVRNCFFRNLGDGSFEETGELVGLAYDRTGNATGAMGVDVGHYRNDADLGFMIGNFANEMTSVYVSQGDPNIFADEAIVDGIGAPSRRMLSFGVLLFDYDLDGRLDVLQANGHLEGEIAKVDPSQSYRQPAQLFWNAGADEGFLPVDASEVGELAKPLVGRGAAYADIDNDGDLDIVITQVAGPPVLIRNDQETGHHWLRLDLRGQAPNREAIGARVELVAGEMTQQRDVMPTRSYQSQVERILTFGLGAVDRVESLKIIWPNGSEQWVDVGMVDQVLVVDQAA